MVCGAHRYFAGYLWGHVTNIPASDDGTNKLDPSLCPGSTIRSSQTHKINNPTCHTVTASHRSTQLPLSLHLQIPRSDVDGVSGAAARIASHLEDLDEMELHGKNIIAFPIKPIQIQAGFLNLFKVSSLGLGFGPCLLAPHCMGDGWMAGLDSIIVAVLTLGPMLGPPIMNLIASHIIQRKHWH
ncbi:hypothetical protein K439DRAFT_1656864, partial [Ramaria rubella]